MQETASRSRRREVGDIVEEGDILEMGDKLEVGGYWLLDSQATTGPRIGDSLLCAADSCQLGNTSHLTSSACARAVWAHSPANEIENKPAAQAAGADPSRCNFTTRQNLAGPVKLPYILIQLAGAILKSIRI